jgi:hypothetical protein
VDPEYDAMVSATYQLPSSYVRYSKKIDEPDLIVDYCCEAEDEVNFEPSSCACNTLVMNVVNTQEWIASRLPTLEKYNCQDFLTTETVETVIGILERLTAMGDVVSQVI